MSSTLSLKRDALLASLRDGGRVAVAFSGGVDSAVVAQAAYLACGESAFAITAVSPSLASGELENARVIARQIGIRHEVINTQEFAQPGYVANAGNRCYFCKTELYSQIEQIAERFPFDVLVNGANADDVGDHRPGMIAASEHQVRSPLLEAGLTKAEVRDLAREWGLPVWDKPASPCLSSRIAYGVEVTPERVARVDAAEVWLRDQLGIRELRVRLEANDLARIELPMDALPQLASDTLRERVATHLRSLGFRYVTLDLEGFRSGSLNAVLSDGELVPLSIPSR
ncbi:MAG: ATP-dependent sacrificial sulfur transferase LarE [Planctomycetaceae bacterium]